VQNRTGGEPREPYLIVSYTALWSLRARLTPAWETVDCLDHYTDRIYVEQQPSGASSALLTATLRNMRRSTWGDFRVDVENARELLEHGFGVGMTAAKYLGVGALKVLEAKLAALPPLPKSAGTTPVTTSEADAKAAAREERELIRKIQEPSGAGLLDWCGASGQALTPGHYDRARLETKAGALTTTVSELAEKLKITRRWVRSALKSHGCPGVTEKSSDIPTPWLHSDRGRDFMTAAFAEMERRRNAEGGKPRRGVYRRFGVQHRHR